MHTQTIVDAFTNNLFKGTSHEILKRDFNTETNQLTNAVKEKSEKNDLLAEAREKISGKTYVLWWISSFSDTKKEELRERMNDLRGSIKYFNEQIVSINEDILKLKSKVKDLEEKLEKCDITKISNWDNLLEVVKLIAPGNIKAYDEIKQFLKESRDIENYPEIRCLSCYPQIGLAISRKTT